MTKGMIMSAIALVMLATAGCSGLTVQEQRALSGAGLGAAGGTVLSAIVGGNLLMGALVGGGAGAAIGALTTDDQVKVNKPTSQSSQ
jgi:hypothetical protein